MEHLAGERLEQRLDGGDVVGRAADHHAQLARHRLHPTAGHRRVDEADAGGGAAGVQRPHDIGRVGREVDDARRAGVGGEHAVRAGHGLLDVGRSGQRQEDAPGPAGGGGGRRHRRGARRRRSSRTTTGRGTRTSYPAATRWPAIGAPIVPVPTNPITVPPDAMALDRRPKPAAATNEPGRARSFRWRTSPRLAVRLTLDRSPTGSPPYCGPIGGVRLRPSSSGRRE